MAKKHFTGKLNKEWKKFIHNCVAVMHQCMEWILDLISRLSTRLKVSKSVISIFCLVFLCAVICLCVVCCSLLVSPHNEETVSAGISDPIRIQPEATPEPLIEQGQDGEPSPESTPESLEMQHTPEPTPKIWFERGDKSDEIITIQERLMKLGYLDDDEPTDFFGPATEAAVLLFQRQHGLKEDGILGNQSYEVLFSKDAKKYVMYEGESGKDIKAFQIMLRDLGYLDDNQVTGYYGSDTVSAVSAFQKRNKLTVDGKAGEKTIEAINSDDAKPSAEYEAEIAAEKKKAEEEAKKNSADARIDSFIKIAKQQLGKPYILGDAGPKTFDCSGLVYYCLRKAGVYTRRMNAAGYSKVSSWQKITSMSSLKKGDLIFFKSDHSKSISHVGIYIGSGTMIDASTSNGKVVQRSCTGSWSKRNFVCGRRPIS